MAITQVKSKGRMERVKIKLMLALLLILGMSAQVSQASEPVTVYMTTDAAVLPMVLVNARSLTSQMFARAGVAIEWRSGLPLNPPTSDKRTVVVHLEGRTPLNRQPGALGFARPYEGVNTIVFYDRVARIAPGNQSPTLLALVMVHEITHLLQRESRHSSSGIMKANWAASDYHQIAQDPFTDEDVDLIRLGLLTRKVSLGGSE
jgi:hypothetical protein